MRHPFLISWLLATLAPAALAAQIVAGGYVAPVPGQPQTPLPGKPTQLRGRHALWLLGQEHQPAQFDIKCVGVGRYQNALDYRLVTAAGKVLAEGSLPRGESTHLDLGPAAAGVCRLELDSGQNACSVRTNVRSVCVEVSKASPINVIYQVRRLFFFVPVGARRFTVHAKGGGRAEAAIVDVFDPRGRRVAGDTTVGKAGYTCAIPVDVPDGLAGQPWSVVLSKAPNVLFEDCRVWLSGDVAPFVANHPARLLVPIASLFAREAGKETEVGLHLNMGAEALEGLRVHLRISEVGATSPLHDRVYAGTDAAGAVVRIRGRGLRRCKVRAHISDGAGRVVLTLDRDVSVAYGEMYEQTAHVQAHDPAPAGPQDRDRGYQVFTRAEPGQIRPNSRPARHECVEALTVTVTPGEYEPANFALYPLRELAGARLRVSDFRTGRGAKLPAGIADVRVARCWPQRKDWRSKTYHIIPELLEPHAAESLHPGAATQFYLILNAPDSCEPGLYRSQVTLEAGGRTSPVVELRVRVLPFRLRTPPGIVWGLYPDLGRWPAFPQEQIEREMVDFKAHGINALMVYPFRFSTFTYDQGKVHADFAAHRKLMALYRKVGFPGTMVVSIQGSERFVMGLIAASSAEHTPAFVDAYRQMLALIKQESVADSWPAFCVHAVDEPWGGERGEAAVRTLKLIKEAGFKTFNTCYREFVRKRLDPYLDYRCYNNIGFGHMRTPEAAAELRDETLAAGDVFWWYGTGCYTNRGVIQDGNVIVNRFMGGFHFWRTRATGAWAWTFLRPKGSAYDDFDGAAHREHKDACIAYPTRDGKGLVPTLQWEGIREGVDDYKYVFTLRALIAEAKATRRAPCVDAAAAGERGLSELLGGMPWLCVDGQFTNGDANRARQRVAELTLRVWQALHPER